MTTRALETPRLRLRPFGADDLAHLAALHGDAEVMAWLHRGVQTRAGAAVELDRYVRTWRACGFGMWALFAKPDGAFVGECGFRVREDGLGVGLRFCLARPYWGRGLAHEAIAATLGYAFEVAGLERIVAVARASNTRSRRTMERAGLRLVGIEAREGRPVAVYALARADWRSAPAGAEAPGGESGAALTARATPTRRST